jgi:hypothetical protein
VSGGRKRRLRRNLGGTIGQDDERFSQPFFDGPATAEVRTAIVLPERLFKALLLSEVERLSDPANVSELERFFGHFFDATAGEVQRAQFVKHFQKDPPRVTLGYPRNTAEWPVICITHQAEEEPEDERFMGDYVGETLSGENPPGGEDQEYVGALFEQTYAIYVLAGNPDVTLYLYHLVKLILLAANRVLHQAGILAPHFSGGELNPEEMLLPDNAFLRVLTLRFRSIQTIPKVLQHRDGRRLSLTGIFGTDVVVNGMRGGVKSVPTGD